MTATCVQPTFISQIESLPPVATIVGQVMAVTSSPKASADDVARVLSTDPTIAAKILRIANSPFYGVGRKVTQITRAVVLLGSVAVRNLVAAVCARDALRASASSSAEYEVLWQHAIGVGAAGDLIARRVGYRPPEEAFLAGLLHDIGQLAMVAFQPEAFHRVFTDQGQGKRFLSVERTHLGIDHVQAGYKILSQWGLPEVLCSVVQDHHLQEIPVNAGHARLLAIVMLGDIMAHMVGMGLDVPAGTSQRALASAEFLRLSDSDQLQVLNRLGPHVEQILEMLTGDESPGTGEDRSAPTRVIWVSTSSTSQRMNVGQLLLEHRGYQVVRVTEKTLVETARPTDIIVLDLPGATRENIKTLAGILSSKGFKKMAVLAEHTDETPLRERDPYTGICRVPRLFTAFDIKWMEGVWGQ